MAWKKKPEQKHRLKLETIIVTDRPDLWTYDALEEHMADVVQGSDGYNRMEEVRVVDLGIEEDEDDQTSS